MSLLNKNAMLPKNLCLVASSNSIIVDFRAVIWLFDRNSSRLEMTTWGQVSTLLWTIVQK